MNLKRIALIVTAVLVLGGCQNRERSITGSYGNTISFTDIKSGDQVKCLGTVIDAQTIHATQIEVQDAPGAHGGH